MASTVRKQAHPRRWRRVIFSYECDNEGNCPRCRIDYGDCGCPGPSQEEEYDYREDAYGLLALKKVDIEEPPQ